MHPANPGPVGMLIEIWFDLVCPFSYIGRHNLDTALKQFPQQEHVEILLRSFELDTEAPRSATVTLRESLIARSGESPQEIDAMLERIAAKAARSGLQLNLAQVRPVNTFDAHRLLYLAASQGLQLQAAERMQRACFTESAVLSDPDTLVRLMAEVGLPAAQVREVLADDLYTHEVSADEFEARSMGVTGVPYMLMDGRLTLTGALEPEIYAEALQRALKVIH